MPKPRNAGYKTLSYYVAPPDRTAKKGDEVRQKSRKNRKIELKYCPECKRVYQIPVAGGKTKLDHYKNMPTYGLERITCPDCENKKGE